MPSSHAKWQKTLHRLFDAYVAARSSAVQAALPSLERSLAEKVAAKNGGGASLDARLEAAAPPPSLRPPRHVHDTPTTRPRHVRYMSATCPLPRVPA